MRISKRIVSARGDWPLLVQAGRIYTTTYTTVISRSQAWSEVWKFRSGLEDLRKALYLSVLQFLLYFFPRSLLPFTRLDWASPNIEYFIIYYCYTAFLERAVPFIYPTHSHSLYSCAKNANPSNDNLLSLAYTHPGDPSCASAVPRWHRTLRRPLWR